MNLSVSSLSTLASTMGQSPCTHMKLSLDEINLCAAGLPTSGTLAAYKCLGHGTKLFLALQSLKHVQYEHQVLNPNCLALPTYSYHAALPANCKSSELSSSSGCCTIRKI